MRLELLAFLQVAAGSQSEPPDLISATADKLISTSEAELCDDGHCTVPAGSTWIFDQSIDVKTLTIYGTVKWDTEKDGLELRTGHILVGAGGYFQIGSRSMPMEQRATIYIKKGLEQHMWFGDRFLASEGEAHVEIHGRRLARTWTLLSRTAESGTRELFLKHDLVQMGWRIGDHIGVATTSRGVSPEHQILDIRPASEWRLALHSVEAGVQRETPPSNVIDGLLDTEWSSWCVPYCTGTEHWITVQLPAASHVSRVKLFWNPEYYAPAYKVEVCGPDSCEGVVEEVSAADIEMFWTRKPQEVKLGLNGTYIKVTADPDRLSDRETPSWAGLRLYEIVAYGKEQNSTAPDVIYLDRPLEDEHWGGFREVEGYSLEMAAEVVNLNRSVVITGDHDDFFVSNKGLHTISAHGGIMDVRYTRIEYCGQRNHMGKYCLHFHHAGQCPECIFLGNAVYQSAQIGITVHGTHRALVDNNIMWDVSSAGIYTEDGNEMFNTLSNNVVICSWHTKCSTAWASQLDNAAGIYMIGMTNNVIQNRVAGFENCIWTHGSIALQGQGKALGRVCPQHTPFATFRGNVCHDNSRFGIYLDNQRPRNIERDTNGFVIDMGTCSEFTEDGRDNGLNPANVIEDQFDWHNEFVGQYSMGDIAFVRMIGVNNAHNMYWKESKNFADGQSHHIRDSLFLSDPNDDTLLRIALFAGPAGPFTFRITNTTFAGGNFGCGALCAAQHCGRVGAGGPCNVQYLLSAVNFSQVRSEDRKIVFGTGAEPIGYVQPIFLATDDSLGGYRSMVSQHLNGFADVSGCEATNGTEWDGAVACHLHVRRLNLWSADMGEVRIKGAGYYVQENNSTVVQGMNAGKLLYEPMHGGYGGMVLLGENYSLEGEFRGDVATEFSDLVLETTFGLNEVINLTVGDETCQVSVKDDRSWLGVQGKAPWTSPMSSCLTAAFDMMVVVNGTTSQPSTTATVTSDGTCVKESEVPCCPDGSCTDRCTGTQCCPSAEGSRTCPSASTVEVSICALGKKYDCTGTTGIAPPGRVDGECEFPNPPAMGYYWDPFCFFGQLGCFADGVNVECRFCGDGAFAEVTCVTTTTTTAATTTVSTTITTTTAGECAALGGGLKQCSDDGCTVLAGGMLSRTCRQYCLEHHLDCVAAWEDSDDDCNILASLTCDQIYDGTPDLICQCAPLPPPPAVWIQNAQGHCLMAQEFNRSGAAVKLHPCLDPAVPAEQWIHFPSGQLKNPREDMRCLHVAELNTPGSLLVMWQCSADEPAQNFTMDAETGQMRIGGLCLESRSGAEILDVVTAACGASSNQFFQWGESQYMTTTTTTVGWTDGVWGRPTSSSSGLWQHREGHCVSSQLLMANCDATSAAQFFAYNQSLLQIAAGGLCLEAESSSGGLTMRTCDPTSEAQHFAYNVHAGLVWNRQSQCVTAADPFQTGLSLHLEPCNATKNSQLWFLNSIATTTLAPVRVGFHVLQQNGLCLAAKDNSSRSCLEMRQCKKEDDAQLWFYNEQWHHFENGFGKCLMAPHAGGVLKAKISFTPVDGGESRACRGTSASDFGSSNYLPFLGIDSLDTCKDLCRERASCTGIEFNPFMKRCEVWIKPVGMTVGAYNFSCYAASLEDPTLAIFEAVDGGVGRVCRGDNPGDNAASYYTQSWAESQEDCQRQCSMATGHCTGFEFHKFGRCELWSKPVGSSAGISGYSCRALATVIMQDCNSSDFRQMWQMDNEGHISSLKDGACLDAVNDGVGGRVRLLTCSAMDASRTWSTETVQVEQQNAVTS
eukprot:CAMPEP_0181428788 /NCGR_PEP_ID=MMETSP1110-20121109/16861_1 /TAXON_ID=174948 /ORGANISM="Symbiodinium sp., Strain CCMP421" /LENGTH=1773 /DNA_ID=CAMNT_0023552029 /DNA_START=37 /DNA_END=5358 /DNA_ORIENTATION=-